MSRFIPVEPEKWAEMVKAWSENADLKAEVERLTWASQGSVKYVDHTMALTRQSMEHHKEIASLKSEVERLTSEQQIKAIPVEAKIMDRLAELKAQVSGLQSKCNLLREAGDDLWYCIRHNDKLGMQEAIDEWKEARHE